MEPEVDVVHSEAPSCLTEKTLSSVILKKKYQIFDDIPHGFPGV